MANEIPAGSFSAAIADFLAEGGARKDLPVETWNPSVCNDIGARIRADGTWEVGNGPIGRPALVKLFASILRRDADGSYWLVTPVEKVPVAVDDAPFMAVEMAVDGDAAGRAIAVRTNVDDRVTVGPQHPLRFSLDPAGGGLKPYVRVRGRLDALFTRALYYDLVELAEPAGEGGGDLGIWSSGTWFPLVT